MSSARIPLKKIDAFVWEIPKTYNPKMRVPARIYADEVLLEKMRGDLTLWQITNVAQLPGIYKYAIVLPDGHQGYGFPIGGVAAFDAEEGVISPGGVGYDINCLPPDTKVLTPLGYRVKLVDLAKGGKVTVMDSDKTVEADVAMFLSRRERILYVIRTESGYVLKASGDHPILTREDGMVEASKLVEGMYVAIHPFEGVEYEEPREFTIVDGMDMPKSLRRELEKRGLLPLKSNNPKLPLLLKILGYAFGDGIIYGKNLCLYGKKEDLEDIRRDIEKIGYKASIYSRDRIHRIGEYEFKHTEYMLKVSAKSLVELLYRMGYPKGRKSSTKYRVPPYIFKLPLWMKRLFLATYFGAELSKPKTLNGYNFYMPELKVVKEERLRDNAIRFLDDIRRLLNEFGIEAVIREAYRSNGKVCVRLLIKSSPENLVKLYSKIGYEYNAERKRLSLAAVIYIKLKARVTREREILRAAIRTQHLSGVKIPVLISVYGEVVNRRFIERSIYEDSKGARIPRDFPTFDEFVNSRLVGQVVYDRIESIAIERYEGMVYDITVANENHNFIADCFVVSNCGVRLVRTDLRYEDVKPVLRRLIDTLYNYVPSGLGSTGRLRLSDTELNKVLSEGVDWAIDNGYGWSEDAEYCEEGGHMETADPDLVSQRAKNRGRAQLGTLGSGNHFLEVQVVDKIYNPSIAKELGIYEEGQITVMIHTGSRGLGHQVCSDYLRVMEHAVRKYRVPLPDRELVSTPTTSREAEEYFAAMSAAANFAWANRQVIMHWTRQAFERVFGRSADELGMMLVYDVAHNIAKLETHKVNGSYKKVYVHRKGATRAFPPGHSAIPKKYRAIGQPVLIPGSMGTASYVLIGTPKAMEISFGSTAHGAGRLLSRAKAKRTYSASRIKRDLEKRGILIRAASMIVIAEESPGAYKDVDRVAEVSHRVGIAKKVVRLVPIAVTKG